MNPFDEAAWNYDLEALRRLVDADPGMLQADGHGWCPYNPLHVACELGHVEMARFSLDRGAPINGYDDNGHTPLTQACASGHAEIVRLLLARGADPARTAIDCLTALMCAARGHDVQIPGADHVAVVRLLLKDGRVPINARSLAYSTAFWMACESGRTETARVLLLEGRADHAIADMDGETPMDVAREKGHTDIVQLLQWFEGELERAALLSKARAVVDATESISKAPEKVGAKTEAEAQRARDAAAPAWLRGRAERGEALPVIGHAGGRGEGEEERRAVCEYMLRHMKHDLYVELMAGLRLR